MIWGCFVVVFPWKKYVNFLSLDLPFFYSMVVDAGAAPLLLILISTDVGFRHFLFCLILVLLPFFENFHCFKCFLAETSRRGKPLTLCRFSHALKPFSSY